MRLWGALLPFLCFFACAEDEVTVELPGADGGKGIGQMVMFASGTTENRVSRSDARTYYMPNGYHFVCRMYYKAQAGSEKFDVNGKTDQTTWLKVDGNLGNSLYWNKDYKAVANPGTTGQGGVDEYGNDYAATAFYWQNRKDHAFVAWTDLNQAVTLQGGTSRGRLKFTEDTKYKVYTGEKTMQWVEQGYRIHGIDQTFASLAAMSDYVQTTFTTDEQIQAFNEKQREIGDRYNNWESCVYYYMFGWRCKYTGTNAIDHKDDRYWSREWSRYMMFFEKVPYSPSEEVLKELIKVYDAHATNVVIALKDAQGKYVAEAVVRKNGGNYIDKDGNVTNNHAEYSYDYYETDEKGNVRYNEENSRYTFYYSHNWENKEVEQYNEFPALAFDLTRGAKTSMSQQPDIAQALEIQAPIGATQESNRVNLYFKHMFSQLQVNVKSAADNSVHLDASNILKAELLGVTEEGYIFTDLDEDGIVGYRKPGETSVRHAAAYKEIDFSKYSENDLKNNPYGTKFQMFELDDAHTELGYLKSFNAIAYGQLQAIRITWKEQGENGQEGFVHEATYRIPNTELVNLRSGVRYIWNIELRRGTLAIIRTEIVDWEVPADEPHNGQTSGTIVGN